MRYESAKPARGHGLPNILKEFSIFSKFRSITVVKDFDGFSSSLKLRELVIGELCQLLGLGARINHAQRKGSC